MNRIGRAAGMLAAFVVTMTALWGQKPALATDLIVTNLNDNGSGSLRQAIANANASAGADTITFAAGLTGIISLTTGQLTISDDLVLTGPGEGLLAISGNKTSRVFEVALGVNVTMSDITIRDGMVSAVNGGGIRTSGRLNLERCTVSNNSAFQGGGIFNESLTLRMTNVTIGDNTAAHAGGGICNDTGFVEIASSSVVHNTGLIGGGLANVFSLATITNSTISNNLARIDGGAILNEGARLNVTDSIVTGNRAEGGFGRGGGIDNNLDGILTINASTISLNSARDGGGINSTTFSSVTITASTISNNSAVQGGGILSADRSALDLANTTVSGNSATAFQGGGIRNSSGPVNISNCTIVNNSSPPNQFGSAGGIFNVSNVVTVKNSIVAQNTNGDCFTSPGASIISIGVNLSTESFPGFIAVTPPQLNLAPLENNGGNTKTHALLPGSIAIDAVTDCSDVTGSSITTDQRGSARPLDGNGDGVFRCDVGSYEAPTIILFDLCIKDDTSGTILRIKSTTGEYELTKCSGIVLSGRGNLIIKGGTIILQHYSLDRRILARIDSILKRAIATVQVLPEGTTLTITDRNIANSACDCGPASTR